MLIMKRAASAQLLSQKRLVTLLLTMPNGGFSFQAWHKHPSTFAL